MPVFTHAPTLVLALPASQDVWTASPSVRPLSPSLGSQPPWVWPGVWGQKAIGDLGPGQPVGQGASPTPSGAQLYPGALPPTSPAAQSRQTSLTQHNRQGYNFQTMQAW